MIRQRLPAEARGLERVAGSLGVRRAHARHQLQHAEPGDPVARIVGPAQHREQVLDVRGLEELEPAVLDVGDVATHQLELEHVAVVGVAEQHGLSPQVDAALATLEHPLDDVAGLRLVVLHGHVARFRAPAAGAAQELAELAAAVGHQRVGGIEHRLRRAVVLLERDDVRRRREALRETRGCSRPWRRGTNRSTARRRPRP